MKEDRKYGIFTDDDVLLAFERITNAVNKNNFSRLISENKILCPNLNQEELETMVISNLVYDHVNHGLSTVYEKLGIKLKEYYGCKQLRYGTVNFSVQDRINAELEARKFCHSTHIIYS